MRVRARRASPAIAIAALVLAACTSPTPPATPSPVPTREPNTVSVSALLDLSGGRAPSGQSQRDALQLWLDRPPPTATLKVRVKFVDVASSSARLLLELRRAVTVDRADAIIVGVSVAGDASFADAAEVARIPLLLTLPAPEPVSGGRGAWLFALAPTPELIARVVAADIVDRGVVAPMLLATDDTPPAAVERVAFAAELARRGIERPTAVSVTGADGATRVRSAMAVAKSAVLTGAAASYGDVLRAVPPFARPSRVYLSYLTETADITSLREASASVAWPGSRRVTTGLRGGDLVPPFLAAFGDRHGQPSTPAASAYDALTLIEAAAARAPAEIDAVRLRQALEANTFAGVVTRYAFTSARHAGFAADDLSLLVWDPQRNVAVVPATPITDR